MQTVIQIHLSGHPTLFQLDEDAYQELQRYFDRAKRRLKADPDREEVLLDLEQSIGDKLAHLLRAESRVVTRAEVSAVLEQVGAVNADNNEASSVEPRPAHRGRRLYRVQEGQWVAGVCQGLAMYSDVSVDWVRTIFLALCIFAAGLPLLIYIALMFLLPVVRTKAEYLAMQESYSSAA